MRMFEVHQNYNINKAGLLASAKFDSQHTQNKKHIDAEVCYVNVKFMVAKMLPNISKKI